ncbi:MAG TPA: DUF72 domain-containing protein, partial [Thermodesulfobacteriota bacterium]|nr:DUF72 domain-containing protein [Thermodesulfobacteriota bacterium]
MSHPDSRSDIDCFHFRGLHPLIAIGTASDRYAGWQGTIYTAERYAGRISRRTHRVGGRSFVEEVLPVESSHEYFEHFPVLEIDYTFYHVLLEPDGRYSRTFSLLSKYREQLHENDRIILKVPQAITAHRLREGTRFIDNPDYLNPVLFTERFYNPVRELLGPHLGAFIFEQEYHRTNERISAERAVALFDEFFSSIPSDDRYHVELRTADYLTPEMFGLYERTGIGQVLSHWTWLPSLSEQFRRADKKIFNRNKVSIIRLLTPRGMKYEDAYVATHPFDSMIEGMLQPS